MGLFSILETGKSGLQAAQQALNVIAQNVANANTDGYSRQRVEQSALAATPGAGLSTGQSTTLSGVQVTGIDRIKNAFVQAAATGAVGRQSALQSQVDPLNDVQSALNEPSDNGFQEALDSFYSSWHDLANTPTDVTAGTVVLGAGAAVASRLNTLSQQVGAEWTNELGKLGGDVTQANASAANLAKLNFQIKAGEVAGLNVNNLKDDRDLAVNSLASLVGGTAYTADDGQVSVAIGGVNLVAGSVAGTLTLNGGSSITVVGSDPPTLSIGIVTTTPSFGAAAGILSSLRTDLPSVNGQLDTLATSIKTAVNTLQTGGYTLAGAAGTDFFSGTGAADLAVALGSPSDLAVSSIAGAQDGSNALKIADLADDPTASAVLGGSPSPSALYRALTAGIGTQVQGLNTALTAQNSIVTNAQSAVLSDSGVSLDEELTNMLLYQRSYQASAKVITAADEMLQTLMGMV